MTKKWKPIPPVPFELLKKGHEGVIAEREQHGPGALVKTLADEHRPEEIMAVSYRLGALAEADPGRRGPRVDDHCPS